ncbi:MAG: isoprenylcysteine carboxylmethyltransferase family protein [Acetobacteraceae bacterium]|nr:isoprenylcysteine carboxylmethyltransferase family protein [Acetobacteraceae bacterium]
MGLMTGINVVALGCFVSFAWGTKGHFVSDGRMPAGMLVVAVLSLFGWAWFAVRTATSGIGPGAPYALALMAGATCLFWWAVKTTRKRRLKIAFAQDQPQAVYKTGPYRFVRHPFYLSYILYWSGTGLATKGLWGWTVPAILGAIYVGLALQEERRFGASGLSDAYCQYSRDTGMLIPWPRLFRRKGFSRHA